MDTLEDHEACERILAGIAQGDRIGGPYAIARVLAKSLATRRRFDPDDIIEGYRSWMKADGFDSGPTFQATMNHLEAGMSVEDAVRATHDQAGGMTAGCNPAHRIGPIAAFAFIPLEAIAEIARREARLTHFHAHAGEASVVAALVSRRLVMGDTIEAAMTFVAQAEPAAWDLVERASLNKGGYGPDVVKTALHFFQAADPVAEAVRFAGGANYCPVLVGTFVGARSVAQA